MLARSNKMIHPLGVEIETPLLVPSFSSKGFAFKKKKKKKDADVSESLDALEFSKEFLTESLLVSAYDMYHKHIPFTEEHISTEITFLDSGGYESGNAYDLSTTSKFNYDLKNWDLEKLKEVLNKWPEHKAAIAVSFDHGNHNVSLDQQIHSAIDLFAQFPKMQSDFLIKPETKDQDYIQIDNIIRHIKQLKSFDIIGVTERELGNSILQRMLNIAKIREALNKNGINSPIHIFGSLDPVTSILYFLAGGEIFDGLTWLKYSYFNNAAIYTSNFGVLNSELGINIRDGHVKSIAITKNTYYLQKMKYTMKDFIKHDNFDLFDNLGGKGFGKIIENSYRTFESNL
ncbi:MAG: hypothetical protein ABI550_00515 [Ignavibacteriaceae bacterium]